MAATPEKKVKQSVEGVLKKEDVYYFFPATHGFGRSGVPDVVGCLNGYFFAVECKAGTNKPTQLQQRELAAIGAAGGRALVINENNLDELADLLRHLAPYDSISFQLAE